ncbi:MAG: 1-acyl-sn-glycerol-3-phosphate acyltransferase, partial [Muribaculaceae bacterium]|nr:1-acyl-sn-glycerol-3-phosphate acyltransferase [Muribaculaceae bacterium]
TIHSQNEFQTEIMWPFLEMLADKTTDGVAVGGLDNINPDNRYTFITNHRDIVLDASFLNLCMLRNKLGTTEIAIGNNLLIYEWIADLVKLNKSFIVKRDVRKIEALKAAKQLSAYIHHAINDKRQSVWIAQREGRAKDSNDVTQESLVKMLALGGKGSVRESLLEINLLPSAISYEYDPNDYLKAREFLMRKRNPEFHKSQHDDLLAMETGLVRPKGRVHVEIGRPVNDAISALDTEDKNELVRGICHIIDNEIHRGYKIFPINYIAADTLSETPRFSDLYTQAEVDRTNGYLDGELDKASVGIDGLTSEEREYMRVMMLRMYANPLKNKLCAR